MVDIARTIQGLKARWNRATEDRRLIDRQKLMIDPTSIVLYEDFFISAVEPAASSHSSFQSVFAKGEGIQNATGYLAATGQVPVFTVPLSYVEGAVKDRAVQLITAQVDEAEEAFREQEKASIDFFKSMCGSDIEIVSMSDIGATSKQQTIDHMVETTRMPAYYVQDLTLAMDLHRTLFGGRGVGRYERAALMRDEGHHAVNFWHAVNNLRDYSGFFPNKPPPRGDNPDDKSGAVKVGAGKPAYSM